MTRPTSKKGIHFPNLNGLRFIAALMVILLHYEELDSKTFNQTSAYKKSVMLAGYLGVRLFFTLSGFLITYLLLVEKKKTQTINIKDFYIRRILRIWPLYYLIVLGALFIFNNVMYFRIPGTSLVHHHFFMTCFFLLSMLPNISHAMVGWDIPYAFQAWSIGVEEQFYLFWPHLIKRSKNIFKPFLIVIISYLVFKIFFYALTIYHWNNTIQTIYSFICLSCFDIMAIGGFAALILFYNSKWLTLIYSKPTQIVCFILVPVLVAKGVDFGFFQFEIYSLLFAIIILNLAGNKNVLISLENKQFNYLGKISYGLYMYHLLGIRTAELVVHKFPLLNNHWLQFLIVLIITIILSATSYELFEKFFIKRKIKYSKIISGDNYKA